MEFELNGNFYRIGKLSAMEQFHVSRRIAPIIPTIIPLLSTLTSGGKVIDGKTVNPFADGLGDALEPLAECIASMSDEHSEYVLMTCLGVSRRKVGDSWAQVWNKQHNACMFDDIDLSVMVNIAFRVIRDSLQPFIRGLFTSQQDSPIPPN